MRFTYTTKSGLAFTMRTFTERDIIPITGRLPVMPVLDEKAEVLQLRLSELEKRNAFADRLMAVCSKPPLKITLDDPDEVPDGTIPVCEIPDADYHELMNELVNRSGMGKEAADEVRPSSATDAAS